MRASKVVKGDGKAQNEVEQAEQLAGTDPERAATKAAAAVDDAGTSKARRREMIAEAGGQ